MIECVEVTERNQDDISRRAGIYLYMGTKVWLEGKAVHREDGPAVVSPDGTERWYVHGKEITGAVKSLFRAQQWSQANGLDTLEKQAFFRSSFLDV